MDLEHLLFIASLPPPWCNSRARLSQRRREKKVLHWEQWKSGWREESEEGRALSLGFFFFFWTSWTRCFSFPSRQDLLPLCRVKKTSVKITTGNVATFQHLCSKPSKRTSRSERQALCFTLALQRLNFTSVVSSCHSIGRRKCSCWNDRIKITCKYSILFHQI